MIVLTLDWLQVISAWLRGSTGGPMDKGAEPSDPTTWQGDHFDMTLRRRLFETWDKHLGYLALIVALPTVWFGLRAIGAPSWLEALPWTAALALILLFILFTCQDRHIDTYEAIWSSNMSSSL